MSNGDRFEGAFNEIDALLRKKAGMERRVGFADVVKELAKKDATVREYRDDLLQYGDLRNAIVHDRGRTPVLIADPRDDVVKRIEQILERISRPKKLRSLVPPIPLKIFEIGIGLPEVLLYLRENDFSQAIVSRDGEHVIMSVEGVAHWLESKSEEDIIELSAVRLGDVLRFEPNDTCVYLRADDTIDDARQLFANDTAKRVFSALVTENGRAKEKPINIITPWDLVSSRSSLSAHD